MDDFSKLFIASHSCTLQANPPFKRLSNYMDLKYVFLVSMILF